MTKSIIVLAENISDTRPAGDTVYQHVATGSGSSWNDVAEPNEQTTYRHAGTFSDIYARITSNATTASSTLTFRVNANPGNMTLSIGIGEPLGSS